MNKIKHHCLLALVGVSTLFLFSLGQAHANVLQANEVKVKPSQTLTAKANHIKALDAKALAKLTLIRETKRKLLTQFSKNKVAASELIGLLQSDSVLLTPKIDYDVQHLATGFHVTASFDIASLFAQRTKQLHQYQKALVSLQLPTAKLSELSQWLITFQDYQDQLVQTNMVAVAFDQPIQPNLNQQQPELLASIHQAINKRTQISLGKQSPKAVLSKFLPDKQLTLLDWSLIENQISNNTLYPFELLAPLQVQINGLIVSLTDFSKRETLTVQQTYQAIEFSERVLANLTLINKIKGVMSWPVALKPITLGEPLQAFYQQQLTVKLDYLTKPYADFSALLDTLVEDFPDGVAAQVCPSFSAIAYNVKAAEELTIKLANLNQLNPNKPKQQRLLVFLDKGEDHHQLNFELLDGDNNLIDKRQFNLADTSVNIPSEYSRNDEVAVDVTRLILALEQKGKAINSSASYLQRLDDKLSSIINVQAIKPDACRPINYLSEAKLKYAYQADYRVNTSLNVEHKEFVLNRKYSSTLVARLSFEVIDLSNTAPNKTVTGPPGKFYPAKNLSKEAYIAFDRAYTNAEKQIRNVIQR